MSTLYYHPRRGGKATKMSELLSKEQFDAVRGAVASLDQLYADHPQLRGSRFEENQILFESLTSNSVTIRALLAHIDALEAEIGALREAILNLGGDPDQAWFWTDRWQQLEREAQEDIDAGRVEDASDFLAE